MNILIYIQHFTSKNVYQPHCGAIHELSHVRSRSTNVLDISMVIESLSSVITMSSNHPRQQSVVPESSAKPLTQDNFALVKLPFSSFL